MINQFYAILLSLFFPYHLNNPPKLSKNTIQGMNYTPIYFDFSLKTYNPKAFDLAKKQCGDKLALKIDPQTKRYYESFGYACTFYGEILNKKIYDFYKINQLKIEADTGDAKAQYALGEAYKYGNYKNKQKAVKWYEKAAEQGFPDAEYEMAWRYERGVGVSKNFPKAMDLYHKAAMHGSEGAQINLAQRYFFGKDYPFGIPVPKDDVQAAKWYEMSAEQGDRNSIYRIGMMYENGWGVSKDYSKALLWYNRGVKQGSREASFALGLMYKNGNAVSKNRIKAKQYFKQACKDFLDEACREYKKMGR